jgi:hypothetical protein
VEIGFESASNAFRQQGLWIIDVKKFAEPHLSVFGSHFLLEKNACA